MSYVIRFRNTSDATYCYNESRHEVQIEIARAKRSLFIARP